MDKIDLTPAKLAELRQKAEAAKEVKWPTIDQFPQHEEYPAADLIAAADPATVLTLVEEIERLRALQCWVIMRKDNRDQVFDGPFFTEEDARLHVPDSLDYEYTVEPWVNQANVIESEAGHGK